MNKLMNLWAFSPANNENGNVEKICLSLKAILPQVAEDYEIIIMNDGSRDRTKEIAERLAREEGRIRAVHHERNLGYGATKPLSV